MLLLCLLSSPIRADEVSESWTGHVEARGNYYWERSTRVMAPETILRLESPSGVDVDAAYLVDAITSASQAAGALVDVEFTELRHDVGLGVGYEFDLGEEQLELRGGARVSKEPDYLSLGANVSAALSLDHRATILRASVATVHDEIRQNFRRGAGARPDASGNTSVGAFDENLDGVVLSVGWEQILTPVLTAQVTYEFGYLRGFLANAYRRVSVADVLRPENHPSTRRRNTLSGRLIYYVPQSGTGFHALYRAYFDSWDIGAITPEVRVYQEIGRSLSIRARYRHYRQTRAFFYQAPEDYVAEDVFVTADPKMSRFHSHLGGAQLLVHFDFVRAPAMAWFRGATLDFSFDHIWNTNRFGNGVISTIGLRVPF